MPLWDCLSSSASVRLIHSTRKGHDLNCLPFNAQSEWNLHPCESSCWHTGRIVAVARAQHEEEHKWWRSTLGTGLPSSGILTLWAAGSVCVMELEISKLACVYPPHVWGLCLFCEDCWYWTHLSSWLLQCLEVTKHKRNILERYQNPYLCLW